jgi:phosphate transport system substrate-binding protein
MSFAMGAALSVAFIAAAEARDQIHIVGSSTVFPFSTAVAEQFGKTTKFGTPVVESTGSGGGFKLFCAGVGEKHPDITNSSRAMKDSEFELCKSNGVKEITEVTIGYDGIVFANGLSGPNVKVSRKQIFMALAANLPKNGQMVPNWYKKWNEIDPSLPSAKIEVLGPPPTSGTRDAFVELMMHPGSETFPEYKAMKAKDSKAWEKAAGKIREDGGYIEAGENDNLIVQKLVANPTAFGIFGYSYLDQNSDKIRGAEVEGVKPTFESIAAAKYLISRPLFFYVKKAHVGVIPGIQEYINEFTSEAAWGMDGYLRDKGLIPLPDDKRKAMGDKARKLAPFSM